MTYMDKFTKNIDIDVPNDSIDLVLKILMQEGELKFREKFIKYLEHNIIETRKNTTDINLDWEDGVNYVIHLLKELDLNDRE